jgi:hypothetical protein
MPACFASTKIDRKTAMPLHPQVQALLDEFSRQGLPSFEHMSVTQARLSTQGLRDLQGEPETVGQIRDRLVPGPTGSLPPKSVRNCAHSSPGDIDLLERVRVQLIGQFAWMRRDAGKVAMPMRILVRIGLITRRSTGVNTKVAGDTDFLTQPVVRRLRAA